LPVNLFESAEGVAAIEESKDLQLIEALVISEESGMDDEPEQPEVA